MSRWLKYTFSMTTAVVTVSGCAYFWMQHFVVSDDPFAVVNHPLQPTMLAAHVLAAPVLLVVAGMVLAMHVVPRLAQTKANRGSGLVSLATLGVMAASGYLLQVTTDEWWHEAWLVAHLGSGVVFAVAYLWHLAVSVRMWRAQRGERRAAA